MKHFMMRNLHDYPGEEASKKSHRDVRARDSVGWFYRSKQKSIIIYGV